MATYYYDDYYYYYYYYYYYDDCCCCCYYYYYVTHMLKVAIKLLHLSGHYSACNILSRHCPCHAMNVQVCGVPLLSNDFFSCTHLSLPLLLLQFHFAGLKFSCTVDEVVCASKYMPAHGNVLDPTSDVTYSWHHKSACTHWHLCGLEH